MAAQRRALRTAGPLLAGLLLVCLWLLRPAGESGTPPAPAGPQPEVRHVGSSACQRCHTAEYQAWQGSQHRRAMQPADARHVLAPFAGERFASSRFSRREGRFFVRTEGPDGRPAEFEIRHTLGLAPLQQYLIAMPNGGLQALDIAWDTRPRSDGGQRWFHLQGSEHPKPGDELHWSGRQNNASFMCVDCHATGFEKNYDPATQRYASRWSEPGVACEACHGPGSRHIAWAEGGPPRLRDDSKGLSLLLDERRGINWRLDPASGNASRSQAGSVQRKELELCARCHSHRSQIADTPAAGAPLLDSHLPSLLAPDLFWPDGQMRAEVYNHGSFLQSRMAAKGVSCSDCHEPHGQALRAPGNALCGQCHAPQRFEQVEHLRHASGSSGAQCVACHMPTRIFMQIDPRHEHAIRVPRPDASLRSGTPEALLDPAQQASLALGLAEYARVQRHNADRPEALSNLAMLEAERGDLVGAEQTLRRALMLAPDLAATQLNLADVQRAAGNEQQAEAQLRAVLKREPGHAAAWHALGLSLLRQRRGDEAIRALQRAGELAPGSAHFASVLAAAQAAHRLRQRP